MPSVSQKTKGIFYILVAAFGFSLMSTFVKLAGDLPAIQKAFFRNFIALLFILIFMLKEHISFKPEKGNLPALFGRRGAALQLLCHRKIKPFRCQYVK